MEFGDRGERGADGGDRFAKLLNFRQFHVSEHGRGAREVVNFLGAEAHDAAGSGVSGDGVLAKKEDAGGLRISLDWAIPFHTEDAIDDDEVGAGGGVDIENGAINAGPMENVFGPAVAAAGHDAEEIFHGEGDASPVMSLELGHGDEKIDAKNGFGKIELLEERGAGFEFDALDIVDIQIAKISAEFAGKFGEADGFKNGLRVTIERWPVADEHASRAEFEKTFAGGGDNGGMGVHGSEGIVADEIGFKQNGFVLDGKTEFAKTLEDYG